MFLLLHPYIILEVRKLITVFFTPDVINFLLYCYVIKIISQKCNFIIGIFPLTISFIKTIRARLLLFFLPRLYWEITYIYENLPF